MDHGASIVIALICVTLGIAGGVACATAGAERCASNYKDRFGRLLILAGAFMISIVSVLGYLAVMPNG